MQVSETFGRERCGDKLYSFFKIEFKIDLRHLGDLAKQNDHSLSIDQHGATPPTPNEHRDLQ